MKSGETSQNLNSNQVSEDKFHRIQKLNLDKLLFLSKKLHTLKLKSLNYDSGYITQSPNSVAVSHLVRW